MSKLVPWPVQGLAVATAGDLMPKTREAAVWAANVPKLSGSSKASRRYCTGCGRAGRRAGGQREARG